MNDFYRFPEWLIIFSEKDYGGFVFLKYVDSCDALSFSISVLPFSLFSASLNVRFS